MKIRKIYACSQGGGDFIICLQTNMAAEGHSVASLLLNEFDDDHHDNGEEEIFSLVSTILNQLGNREEGVRQLDYAEDVIPRYPNRQFKRHFRMRHESFEKLCSSISGASAFQQKQNGGRPMITLEKQVLVFLWYAANKESLRSISGRFNITESAVHKTLRRVMDAIIEKMMKELICWPTGSRIKAISDAFAAMKGLEDAIGAIDGSHIPISGRGKFKENYLNRKKFESVILQAVCDPQLLFTDCYTGWPGSVHDARVFSNSDLKQRTDADPMSMFPGNTFLIGDAAYKLETFLLTPYKDFGHLDAQQTRYNYIHSATRMVIERAFGLLKGRFRRLQFVELRDNDDIVKLIMSCCCMHNFCILEDQKFDDFEIDFDIPHEEEINNFVCYGSSSKDAERKRSSIASKL